MPFIYKLHISHSQHLQTQCQKNGGVGYNFPLLHSSLYPFSFSFTDTMSSSRPFRSCFFEHPLHHNHLGCWLITKLGPKNLNS